MGTNILALVTDAYGSYGGIAQYNRDFLEALAAIDTVDQVTVLPRLAPDASHVKHPSLRLLSPTSNKALYAARALSLCFRKRPDIIYNGHLYHGLLACCLASMFGAKLVSQLHGTEVWTTLAKRHLQPLEASDIVLCVSNDTKAKYLAQSGSGVDNALVLHNTVGKEFVPGDRIVARKKFGLGNEFTILSVGRLDARNGGYKGHEQIIRALPELEGLGLPVRYLIAGIGDDKARLEQVVMHAGVESKVRFLGKVPFNLLPDLYRAADLFALPSTGEGFGIVYLEAMASGTPAIGLDVGGASDALCPGKLGYCVAPEEFKTALISLVQNTPAQPERLGHAVQERFGQAAFHSRVAHILKSVRHSSLPFGQA